MLNIDAGKPVEAVQCFAQDQQIMSGLLLLRELQMRRAAAPIRTAGAPNA